jgi:hypothetical protein
MSGYTITYSAELMRNFLQSEIMAAEAKFEALQTQTGASLLFSIGTDDALYLTREESGTASGWTRNDISSALIARDFGAGARCVNFGTAQCPHGTTAMIHLAMVVNAGQDDHLYLSLNNPDADTSWADAPAWTAYPFDATDHQLPRVKIVNAFLSEATGKEYIVVDVLRDPASTQDLLYRYYIDPAKTGGHAWQPGALALDLSATGYTSCLGRKVNDQVDGLYTSGQVSGYPQLMYQPLYMPYGGTPKPSRFSLPGGRIPDFIAASRNADNTSDLYLTSGTSLYCLPARNADGTAGQADLSVAVKVADSAMFAGARALFAAPTAGKGVIVWGLNASDQVFYTTCVSGNPVAGPWSVPLPIVTGAEQVSPYLDRVADANTFFCHTGTSKLTKAVKSPDTGMWKFGDITLDPPDTSTAARDVMSYTTRIRVTDADGQPVSGLQLAIQASNVTSLHINYLHYTASPVTPVQVVTDDDGSVTIVEPVGTLAGSQITVTAGGTKLTVNPMDKAFSKAASLTTHDAITGAVIISPDGSTRPLCPSDTSSADLQTVADANQALGQAYGAPPAARLAGRAQVAVGGALISDVGDLLAAVANAIADATLDLFQVVESSGAWQLLVRIGGQPFQAVLNTIESIAESAYHVLTMIVDDIKKVLEYLEFLFEWNDITRTKKVLKTMLTVFLSYGVDQIEAVRAGLDQQLLDAEAALAAWAGEPPSWAGLSSDTPAQMSGSAPEQSSPGAMLSYHYQNNADNTTSASDLSREVADPSDDLAAVLEREGDTLYGAVENLIDLGGRLPSMQLPDILTELVAIIGEAVLESTRNILDAAFDVISDVAKMVVTVLDTPIHIPVVSDVLNFFGVPDFSILDIICWIGAIPATLLCKISTGRTPFPDDEQTAALIAVPDYPSLLAMFGAAPPVLTASPRLAATAQDRTDQAKNASGSGHIVSAASSFVGGPLNFIEAQGPAGSRLSTVAGGTALIGAGGQGVAAYVVNKIVPIEPIRNPGMAATSDLIMITRVAVKATGVVVPWVTNSQQFRMIYQLGPLQAWNWRGLIGYFDMATAVAALVPSIYHFIELAPLDETADKVIAQFDEFSTIMSVISRICYTVAVTSEGSIIAKDASVVLLVADVLTGLLQLFDGVAILTN